MRKLLYISITISLIVVFAAIAHYQWHAHELRHLIARSPNSTGVAQDTGIQLPVASNRNHVVETKVSENPEDPVMDIESAANYEAASLKFDQLYNDLQMEIAAFHKAYQHYEEVMARDTPSKRKSAELERQIAVAESEAYAAQRAAARARARAGLVNRPVPSGLEAEIEETLDGEDGWERMEAQHGDLKGFLDYLTAKYFPSTPE